MRGETVTVSLTIILVLLSGVAGVISMPVAAAPGGMTAVPDENISEDIPAGANVPVSASDLEGAVLASEHADSMEIVVTTPARADDIMGSNANVIGGGDVALVLRDSTNHGGREVAIDAGVLKTTMGFAPEVLFGTHSSGESWQSAARYEDGFLSFDVERFSSNTVTFRGEVQLTGSPATNGASYSYEVSDSSAATDPQITLTGSTSTAWENVSAAGVSNGQSVAISPDGNAEPVGPASGEPELTFTGTDALFEESNSGTDATDGSSTSFTPGGDNRARNANITFSGQKTLVSGSASATNVANGETNPASVGGEATPENVEVTFNGDTVTNPQTHTGTFVSGGSTTFSVGGNLDPSGQSAGGEPTLQLTATEVTDNEVLNPGGGQSGTFGSGYSASQGFKNPPSTITSFSINDPDDDYGSMTVDVYAVREKPDGTYGEGTLVKNNWDPTATGLNKVPLNQPFDTQGSTWVTLEFDLVSDGGWVQTPSEDKSEGYSSWNGGTQDQAYDMTVHSEPLNVQADANDGTSVSFGDMSDGQTTTKEFDITTSGSDLSVSAAGGSLDYTLDYTERTATEDPSVDVDGDGTADASHSGILTSGQTSTVAVDAGDLSTGSNSIEVSTASGSVTDWTLNFDEAHWTEDPAVDVDGDGNADALVSGTLGPGETATRNLSELPEGTVTLDFATTQGAVDWTVDYLRVEHTENPRVDVDGDGNDEVSHPGTLAPGETASYALDVSLLDSSLDVSTASGTEVDLSLAMQEVTETEDTTVTINGENVSYAARVADGETTNLTADSAWIVDGQNTVSVTVSPDVGGTAPPGQVLLDYSHGAAANQTVEYQGEKWSERYNVSMTYVDDRENANVTIPFAATMYDIRDAETSINGSAWSDAGNFVYSNGELVIEIGDVDAGTTVGVRANGSKVVVNNGSISVVEPTSTGQTLDSKVQLDSWASDSYIAVGGTPDGNLVHYSYEESWTGAEEKVRVDSSGGQKLYLPNAAAGSTTRVSTIPIEVAPKSGNVDVLVTDPSSTQPKFNIRPGEMQGDVVEFTFIGATSGEDYILYSQTNGVVHDSGTANSPVTLVDDDSPETLQFQLDSSSSSATGGGGGGGGEAAARVQQAVSGADPILALGAGFGLILLAVLLVRRIFGAGTASAIVRNRVFQLLAVVALVGTVEVATGFVLTTTLASGLAGVSQFVILVAVLVVSGFVYVRYIRGADTPQEVTNVDFTLGED